MVIISLSWGLGARVFNILILNVFPPYVKGLDCQTSLQRLLSQRPKWKSTTSNRKDAAMMIMNMQTTTLVYSPWSNESIVTPKKPPIGVSSNAHFGAVLDSLVLWMSKSWLKPLIEMLDSREGHEDNLSESRLVPGSLGENQAPSGLWLCLSHLPKDAIRHMNQNRSSIWGCQKRICVQIGN